MFIWSRGPSLRKCIADLKGKALSLRNSLPGWLLDPGAGNLTKDGRVLSGHVCSRVALKPLLKTRHVIEDCRHELKASEKWNWAHVKGRHWKRGVSVLMRNWVPWQVGLDLEMGVTLGFQRKGTSSEVRTREVVVYGNCAWHNSSELQNLAVG